MTEEEWLYAEPPKAAGYASLDEAPGNSPGLYITLSEVAWELK